MSKCRGYRRYLKKGQDITLSVQPVLPILSGLDTGEGKNESAAIVDSAQTSLVEDIVSSIPSRSRGSGL